MLTLVQSIITVVITFNFLVATKRFISGKTYRHR